MVGRGTRLRLIYSGPDQPKEFFYLFDYCKKSEFLAKTQKQQTVLWAIPSASDCSLRG